jgi:hypothetical protein
MNSTPAAIPARKQQLNRRPLWDGNSQEL